MKIPPLYLLCLVFLAASLFPSQAGGPVDEGKIRGLEAQLPDARGKERLYLLVKLSRLLAAVSPQKAFLYAGEALKIPGDLLPPVKRAELLLLACDTGWYAGKAREMKPYADALFHLAQQRRLEKYMAAALRSRGYVEYEGGNYPEVLGYCSRALEIAGKIKDRKETAIIQRLTGMAQQRQGKLSLARENFLKARKGFEELGDKRLLASTLNSTGSLFWELDDFDRALEYYRGALRLFNQVGWIRGTSTVLNNMGNVYDDQGMPDKALDCYQRALVTSRQLGLQLSIANNLNNIGDLYQRKGVLPKALSYYKRALHIAEAEKNLHLQTVVLLGTGTVYRDMGNYKKAERRLLEGVETGKITGVLRLVVEGYKYLSGVYASMGDDASALRYFKQYKKSADSLLQKQNRDKIADMQTHRESDEKEKQIDLLKQQEQLRLLEIRHQKIMTHYAAAVILIIFTAVAFIFSRYRLKSRITRALRREAAMHRLTTHKLAESEEKFRALAENAAVGIYIIQDNVVKYVNPSFLKTHGYKQEDVIGQSPLKVTWPEDEDRVKEVIRTKLTGTSETVYHQFRGLTREGEYVYHDNYSVGFMFRGKPAILGILVEISERKKLEAELLKSRKLEAFGLFAGGIAHDFNNLLGVIRGYLEMSADNLEDGGSELHVSALKRVTGAIGLTRKAAALARKLITYTRDGRVVPRKLLLHKLLEELLETLPEAAPFIHIKPLHGDLPPCYGDAPQLKQALAHVLENAYEAMGDAVDIRIGVRVDVVTLGSPNRHSLKRGEYLRIHITDNGRGIPPEQLESIFEPRFMNPSGEGRGGGNSTKNRELHLGLPLSYSIIKKHNGHIEITSREGEGTRVEILLPAFIF